MFGTIPPPTRSAPEQNPCPAPVSTTTRHSLSRLISRRASRSGTITSNAIAFMRSGRFSVTSVTCGRGFSITMNDMAGVYVRLLWGPLGPAVSAPGATSS